MVVMWLLGYCGWLPGCYVVVKVFVNGCNLVVGVLRVVARVLCGR